VAITHVFASIPVIDRDAAVAWYGRLAGRDPDLIPNENEAAWRLPDTGWVYVIADRGRVGSAQNTILVDDLAGILAALAERGIASGPVETFGNGVRRATVTDPDRTVRGGKVVLLSHDVHAVSYRIRIAQALT
jgi:glyoxylase I family protein